MFSSTGSSHTRGESIARRRASVSFKQSPLSPQKLRAALPINQGTAHASEALDFLRTRRRRRVFLQVGSLLVILGASFYFLRNFLQERKLVEAIKERKARLDGTGESWVLPSKWREVEEQAGLTDGLPECKRVMLYKFSDCCGFASEINILLTASVIASKLGYVLLADDSPPSWNYGSLQEYFLPKPVYCRPPRDWFLQSAAVPLGEGRWQGLDRVWTGRDRVEMMSNWIREETLDNNALRELQERTYDHILPEGQTLPDVLEDIFIDYAAATKELWKPNDKLAAMIRSQRMDLGLGAGGLRNRKHSPTFGGKRRETDPSSPRTPGEEVESDKHDFDEAGGAERSDRGAVIGVHVRLGDKRKQWEEDVGSTGVLDMRYGNLSVILEGALDAVRRLSGSSSAQPGYSREHPLIFPADSKPTLLLMTAENSVLPLLESDPLSSPFTLERTSAPPLESLRQWDDLLKLTPEGELTSASTIMTTFKQSRFNDLPMSLRIHLTRFFLRDLTVLSLYADAMVVTGSSNVGLLGLLIAGEDAVVGPRSLDGSYGGRVRSIDSYWHPTPRLDDLYK